MLNWKETSRVIRKALAWNSKPTEESFPELPEVLIWLRFVIAVVYGSYLGLYNATSPTSLLQAFNLLAFIPVMYCRLYLGVEAESFGAKIIFSGLLNGGALALLLWVYFFTASHESAERQLSDLLMAAASASPQETAGQVGVAEEPIIVNERESEF